MSPDSMYPLPSFYFEVKFDNNKESFQEVSGISAEFQYEEIPEGGEAGLRLPKTTTHPPLVLKRGVMLKSSPFVDWCIQPLDAQFQSLIKPKLLQVSLLNEEGTPVRAWSFSNAYPLKWEMSNFNSMQNEIAIETVTLSYQDIAQVYP